MHRLELLNEQLTHLQAMVGGGEVLKERMAVSGEDPELIHTRDELESLLDDERVSEVGGIEGASEEGDIHGIDYTP